MDMDMSGPAIASAKAVSVENEGSYSVPSRPLSSCSVTWGWSKLEKSKMSKVDSLQANIVIR
jgi:hypothetical protein